MWPHPLPNAIFYISLGKNKKNQRFLLLWRCYHPRQAGNITLKACLICVPFGTKLWGTVRTTTTTCRRIWIIAMFRFFGFRLWRVLSSLQPSSCKQKTTMVGVFFVWRLGRVLFDWHLPDIYFNHILIHHLRSYANRLLLGKFPI